MNSLVIEVSKKHLENLLRDPELKLVIHEWEGKGMPQCLVLSVKKGANPSNDSLKNLSPRPILSL